MTGTATFPRKHALIVRTTTVSDDEDGTEVEETTHHCPNCDVVQSPGRPFCLRCGTALAS